MRTNLLFLVIIVVGTIGLYKRVTIPTISLGLYMWLEPLTGVMYALTAVFGFITAEIYAGRRLFSWWK